VSLAHLQDKRPATAGSSGFLSSLGKGLMGGVKDMRLASPKSSPRDLNTELRSSSSPNIALMARESVGSTHGSQQQGGLVNMQGMQSPQHQRGSPRQQQQQQQQQEVPLPPGWEAKYDAVNKRVFYVDHNTKTTTWTRPASAGAAAVAAGAEGSSHGSAAQQGLGQSGGQQLLDGSGSSAGWSASGGLARKSRPASSKAVGEDGGDDSDSGEAEVSLRGVGLFCWVGKGGLSQ
jgi:hypothetical protein